MSIRRFIKKPSIPSLTGWPETLLSVMRPLLQTIETLTGRRGERLEQLSGTVSVNDVAERVNEIIRVLQDGSDTSVLVGGATTTPADPTPQVETDNLPDTVVNYIINLVPTTDPTRVDIIPNGDFRVMQRRSTLESSGSVPGDPGRAFGPDRWAIASFNVADRGQISQIVTSAPFADSTGRLHFSYLQVARGSAWSNTTDAMKIRTSIEGGVYMPFANEELTITFMVKSSVAGTYTVVMCLPSHSSNRRTYASRSYTVSVADTWEEKSVTFTVPPSSALQYISAAGLGCELYWTIKGGSTVASTAWVADGTNYDRESFSGQANALSTAGYTFNLANVHSGGLRRTYSDEVDYARRYYQRSSNFGGQPYDASGTVFVGGNDNSAGGKSRIWVPLVTTMRAAPAVTTYDPTSATVGKLKRLADGAQIAGYTNNTFATSSGSGFAFELDLTGYTDRGFSFTWEAEAELI